MRKVLALVAAVGLMAAACSDGGDDPFAAPDPTTPRSTRGTTGGGEPTEIRFVSALRQVGGCDALLTHLRGEAAERVGPYGLGGGMYPMPFGEGRATTAADGDDAASAPTEDSASPGVGDTYSSTNVQEVGVDEPDIVKTDGSRVLTLANGVLSVVDARTEPPARVARSTSPTTSRTRRTSSSRAIGSSCWAPHGSQWRLTDPRRAPLAMQRAAASGPPTDSSPRSPRFRSQIRPPRPSSQASASTAGT